MGPELIPYITKKKVLTTSASSRAFFYSRGCVTAEYRQKCIGVVLCFKLATNLRPTCN